MIARPHRHQGGFHFHQEGENHPMRIPRENLFASDILHGSKPCTLDAELKTSHSFGTYVAVFFNECHGLQHFDRDRAGAFPMRTPIVLVKLLQRQPTGYLRTAMATKPLETAPDSRTAINSKIAGHPWR